MNMRWIIRRDMPEVMRIENDCFEFPWSEEDWHKCLIQRNRIGMVAEVAECVVGVMLYELQPKALRILNFAVRPDCQRRGIGTVMVNKLKSKLSYERRKRITLDIRETNSVAHKFFSAQRFRAIKVQRDFYPQHVSEDAYLFQYRLPVCEGK